jgi:hypothetical protein
VMNKGIRTKICYRLGIGYQSLSNSLRRLRELGLLSGMRGGITMNSEYVWRGDLKGRVK